jgi:NADPH:quinone reductase-like Zn-dependent oxidoreductase
MRAITYTEFGGPEVLTFGDVPDPVVGPDAVLVRVRASSVNPVDHKVRAGYLDGVLDTWFPVVPGWDVAGVVEAVGPAVTEFAAGDEVYGYVRADVVHGGTLAELVAAPVRTLARKPTSLSFVEAAGVPLAGLTAYQALVHALGVGEGDVVLVSGAAGGVGSLAVQVAVARGARVIGTASEGNHDFVRSLGAEPTTYGEGLADRVRALAPDGLDAAFDLFGGDDLAAATSLLRDPTRIASIADASVTAGGGHYVFVRPSAPDLDALTALADAGRLHVEVAETFPLERAADAHRANEGGHVRGKVVVTVD